MSGVKAITNRLNIDEAALYRDLLQGCGEVISYEKQAQARSKMAAPLPAEIQASLGGLLRLFFSRAPLERSGRILKRVSCSALLSIPNSRTAQVAV
jgi:hypothetical protein